MFDVIEHKECDEETKICQIGFYMDGAKEHQITKAHLGFVANFAQFNPAYILFYMEERNHEDPRVHSI